MIESLIERWGYLGIALGGLFEGETTLLAAGAMAHRGLLSLPMVLAVAFFSGVLGDQIWFQVGRHFGQPFIERRPHWRRRMRFVDRLLRRYGVVFVLAFRFVPLPLMRTVTPVLLGARGYPAWLFVMLNISGGAAWTLIVTSAGWGIGAGVSLLLGRKLRASEMLLAALALALLLALILMLVRWLRRSDTALDTDPPPAQ